MAVLNFNPIIKVIDSGGAPRAGAAVHEGFCPVHEVRLTQEDPPDNDEPSLVPTAAGRCSECPAWWTSGSDPEKGDWLSVQDVYLDAIRRLTFNPPDVDPPDDYPDD
jgi:hypothetical protein